MSAIFTIYAARVANVTQGYRGAGLDIVSRSFMAIAGIASVFFIIALVRFRKTVVLT